MRTSVTVRSGWYVVYNYKQGLFSSVIFGVATVFRLGQPDPHGFTPTMASGGGVVADDEDFSQERLLSLLQSCVADNGDISMDVYVAGIEELYKLLKRFGEDNLEFVLPEILANLSLLKDYRDGDNGKEYLTVQGMVHYELHNLVQLESRHSGSHTLLRFHRTLEFIHTCLEKIQDPAISDEEFPGEIVKVYTETLAWFHPELMMASVHWALPTFVMSRVSMMENTGFAEDPSEFWVWLKQVTDNLKKLNNAIQAVCDKYQLLNLLQDHV
ncbi:ceramide-1-phosphate transfer protein-like [Babylonia areolata]|uniref:ceramide-1-phosphate transfer protein-like n=1 Tax=Babylonia areolata TaxID=304850 RepID=UPI003FCFE6BF